MVHSQEHFGKSLWKILEVCWEKHQSHWKKIPEVYQAKKIQPEIPTIFSVIDWCEHWRLR